MNSPSSRRIRYIVQNQMRKVNLNKSKASLKANALEKVTKAGQMTKSIGMAEARTVPRVYFKSSKPSDDADIRYHGCDFMGTLSSASGAATIGSNGNIYPHNASLFPRLSAIADLFLKYRFKRLRWHIVGESATTQAGSGAFGSYVTDGLGGALVVNTDAIVRNSEGVVILRGWENGSHEVDVKASGLRWISVDTDAGSAGTGSILGALFSSIPATPAGAGGLSWSVYLEYEIEFAEAFSGSGVDLLKKRLARYVPNLPENVTMNPTQPTLEQILSMLDRFEKTK